MEVRNFWIYSVLSSLIMCTLLSPLDALEHIQRNHKNTVTNKLQINEGSPDSKIAGVQNEVKIIRRPQLSLVDQTPAEDRILVNPFAYPPFLYLGPFMQGGPFGGFGGPGYYNYAPAYGIPFGPGGFGVPGGLPPFPTVGGPNGSPHKAPSSS